MPKNSRLLREYTAALQRYLKCGGEADLERAYELGRQGLVDGLGVLEMVTLHHQSLILVWSPAASPQTVDQDAIRRAGMFFTECMSPFEMTHRAIGEANRALHRVNEALEEEVKRIAHALHDGAGQLLAAVHLSLDELGYGLDPDAKARLQQVKGLLDDVEHQLRHLSHELRPTILDDLGLIPAIEFLSEGVAKRAGLRVAIRSSYESRLPAPIESALYRIVQEALNNISKHARARSVRIRLRSSGKAVHCTITDDGVGFDPNAVKNNPLGHGLGLLGMRERLQPLGGVIKIDSNPGRGTKLLITVPTEAQYAD